MPNVIKLFSRLSSEQDSKEILHGVIVAEVGEAIGHDLQLDTAFLESVVELGNQAPVKVRINHPQEKGDVLSIIGEARSFRLAKTDEGKECVKADVTLFDLPNREQILKLAHQASHLFGMSLDCGIDVVKKLKNGLKLAVAKVINAIDFVDQPAAASALFNAKVDSNNRSEKEFTMATDKSHKLEAEEKDDKKEDKEKGGNYENLCKMLAEFGSRLDGLEAIAKKHFEGEAKEGDDKDEKKEDKEDKKEMSAADKPLQMTKAVFEAAVARISAETTMHTLARVGINPKASNPDAGDDKGKDERQLSAEEIKLCQHVGLTKPEDMKQFAANLAAAEKISNVKF
jgi:hypothetical protein